MNTRHVLVPVLITAVWGCVSNDSHESIRQHITAHARRIEAQEYASARMIAVGDLDGDGVADTAVVYTLEGAHHSNNYEQYLAVSSSRQGGHFFDVLAGGKEIREVDGIQIAAGRVVLVLREYAASDASCCPSRPANTGFILEDGVLIEAGLR